MKVLIVYASAGAGHQKAAEALFEYLKHARPELQLKIVDILEYTSKSYKLLYSKGYIFLISKLPWLWHFLFFLSFFFSNNPLHLYLDYIHSSAFIDLLLNEKPEVVLSTHFLTSSVLTQFKKQKSCYNFRHIAIITDYNLHPFWIGEGVDLYIGSCDYVKEELLKRGVPLEKIRAYGIPVSRKFYLSSDRKHTAGKLQVDASKFTILIISGAIGIGPIEQIVKTLAYEAQLLVVCGSNQRLYKRIVKMRLNQVKPFPLINNVDELMSVSDVVLTKAGGLTITESLVKSLPIIFFASIPGLETANAAILHRYGAALIAKSIAQIKGMALSLKNRQELYQEMQKNSNLVRKDDTLINISNEIGSFTYNPTPI